MIACTTLINSPLKESIDWILIDSTASTNKHRSLLNRLYGAVLRMIEFIYHLLFSRVDVVLLFCSGGFSFREKGAMAILAKWWKKKVILAPRSGLIIDDIERSKSFKKYVVRVLNALDTLICQGESWKRFYGDLSSNPSLQLVVIHNWIELEKWRDFQFKPPSSETKVVFLGWINKNKGVFDLLEASKLTDPNVIFLLGGNGDAFTALEQIVFEQGLQERFLLLDWVTGPKKMELLQQADIFVLPSYREGYPNALLEAMATKTPVISTYTGSIPDLITPGKNGMLIEPGDHKALAEKINQLHQNHGLKRQLAESAFAKLQNNNDLQIALKKMRDVLSCTNHG